MPILLLLGILKSHMKWGSHVSSTRIQDILFLAPDCVWDSGCQGCQRKSVGSSGEYHPQRCRFISETGGGFRSNFWSFLPRNWGK